jgi:sugar/nucleoside kinase (ribokinase family)
MKPKYDLLGLGCAALDEVLAVDIYPTPDTKTRVLRREQHFGGLTATALVAAARLGGRCAYAGRLGLDAASLAVEENLKREGIDTSHAPRDTESGVVHSTIITAQRTGTRNVFSQAGGFTGAHEHLPTEHVVRSARVLLVDHHGVPGAIRAAKIARAAGIAVVADFERDDAPGFSELLGLVDHLIVSERFARQRTGASSAGKAVEWLWKPEHAAVVVTCGENGCWFLAPEMSTPERVPARAVNVIDTTGCGDVFHGAYATALAAGMDLRTRLRFASVAAALKASRPGGQAAIPTRVEVEAAL